MGLLLGSQSALAAAHGSTAKAIEQATPTRRQPFARRSLASAFGLKQSGSAVGSRAATQQVALGVAH
jgi:hypothetical protein